MTGRKQVTTGKHPGVKAIVTQAGTSEAGIEKARAKGDSHAVSELETSLGTLD